MRTKIKVTGNTKNDILKFMYKYYKKEVNTNNVVLWYNTKNEAIKDLQSTYKNLCDSDKDLNGSYLRGDCSILYYGDSTAKLI